LRVVVVCYLYKFEYSKLSEECLNAKITLTNNNTRFITFLMNCGNMAAI
jgi:hypothetical protein